MNTSRVRMDADEIIESGGDFETENWEEEFDNIEEEQEETSDIKPELKKLYQQHPECNLDYIEQVIPKLPLQVIVPGGDKADSNHRTYPFLTNFEKTKIVGLRANQLSKGAVPFIAVPKHITDVKDIARLELEQKRLPYIVKRPLPDGTFEVWRIADLLIL
jgi:DNA-directed RNA polymerase I, II, and III subunit RPABC2